MTLGERIKKVRKDKNLTQQELAEKIGTTQNSITRYETDTRTPPNAVIALICRTFHVNEAWLRTGEGEIYSEQQSSGVDSYLSELGASKQVAAFIKSYLALTQSQKQAVDAFIEAVAIEMKAEAAQDAPPAEEPYTDEELAIYEKVRAAKEKERGMSSGSTIGESA